jgi:hypothetical protein
VVIHRQWANDPSETQVLEESLTKEEIDHIAFDLDMMEEIQDEGAPSGGSGGGVGVAIIKEGESKSSRFVVRPDLRAYQKFNGHTEAYLAWKQAFVAVGMAQGMEQIFDLEYMHLPSSG